MSNALRPVPAAGTPRFVRGDVNADGEAELTDAIFLLNWIFLGGAEPPCLDAADVDDSAIAGGRFPIGVTDAVRLLQWLLRGRSRPAPAEPVVAADLERRL